MAPPRHALKPPPPLSLRHELVRKGIHLATASLPVAYALGVPRSVLVDVLAVAATLALLIESVRRRNAAFGAWVDGLFGPIMRAHERRSITGATWLLVSCLAVTALLSRNAAIAATWCAAVGDPAAAIIGRAWAGRNSARVRERDGKTVAGALACWVASFGGVWLLAGYAPLVAVPIAVAAALAEAMPVRIDDNVRVAVAAGALAQLLA